MSKYKKTDFISSMKNALRGVALLWKSEKNFRFHVMIGLFVFLLALILGFDETDLSILVLTITIVLLCEMFNTALEFSLDSVFKNKYSKLVGMAKDISAGAVMLSAVASVVVGLILFGNNLLG